MKIAVKEIGKPLKIEETTEKYRTDMAQKYISSKDLEGVWLNDNHTLSLMVDEVGLWKELPLNFLMGFQSPHFPIQKMVGTVVFVRTKPITNYLAEIWDYEVEDLTDEDISVINYILSDEHQNELKSRFKDYGKGYAVFEHFIP